MSKSKDKTEYKVGQIGKYISAVCGEYKLNSEEVAQFLLQTFPELKQKKKCNNCGANMKMWWHMVTPGLVGDLMKSINFVKNANKNEFHLQKDLSLSKNDYNNFQKLRYHGLVTKVKEKAGYWLITKRGGQFLRNEIEIPAGVKTFRNNIEEDGHTVETVRITDFQDRYPTFQSEFAFEYKVGPQVLPFKSQL